MVLRKFGLSLAAQTIRALGLASIALAVSATPALASEDDGESQTLQDDAEVDIWGDDQITTLATLGPFLSENDVRYYVRQAGFPERLVETLVDIAHCESSFGINSYAWGGGNRHTGLFQISDLHHRACGYGQQSLDTFRDRMTDPALNSQCAYTVYVNAGYSLTPWDCY